MKKEQVYVKCNICGSDDFDVLFEEGKAQINRIVKCKHCDLIYANPQTDNVSDVENSHLLAEEGNGNGKSNPDSIPEKYNPETHQYLKKQYLQLKDYAKILDFTDIKKKGKFVEVGSYAGIFLNEAKKRGWEVIGIEPLEIPALYSEKEFGIKAIREYFEEADIEPDSVDVVVSCHVIEHVPDPGAFVRKASELLKTGGNLILETPAYDSLTFKLLKHRERSVRCDGHIYFFTKKSLSSLVEKNGFKVVKHEKVGRTLTLDRLFYNFGIMTGKKVFFSNMSTKLGLDKFVIRLNMRDMQRIYCQKN
jgi:2-polyprenyl-3-methyl-5-hydroxy-6-metoxy-1,4-benzoquinol methylase